MLKAHPIWHCGVSIHRLIIKYKTLNLAFAKFGVFDKFIATYGFVVSLFIVIVSPIIIFDEVSELIMLDDVSEEDGELIVFDEESDDIIEVLSSVVELSPLPQAVKRTAKTTIDKNFFILIDFYAFNFSAKVN